MNIDLRDRLTQQHRCHQEALFPLVESDHCQAVTPKLEQLLRVWEIVEVERYVPDTRGQVGRLRRDRAALARAFVAKAVLGLSETSALVERLNLDRTLRSLCGFDLRQRSALTESLFSPAFAEFTQQGLPERVHAALIKGQLGDALVGHVSRDSTAIMARERPAPPAAKPEKPAAQKRGRPKKGEVRPPKSATRLQKQADGMTLDAMLAELPSACDVGTKRNSKGHQLSWVGYKLHLDSADGMIPLSVIVTSASVHDSQVAIPLATMSHARVDSCYELMDAVYCGPVIREHSESLGQVMLIDHNPRRGKETPFSLHQAERFKERATVERVFGWLKDSFGIARINVRGHDKVQAHFMFAVLTLTADQLMRLGT